MKIIRFLWSDFGLGMFSYFYRSLVSLEPGERLTESVTFTLHRAGRSVTSDMRTTHHEQKREFVYLEPSARGYTKQGGSGHVWSSQLIGVFGVTREMIWNASIISNCDRTTSPPNGLYDTDLSIDLSKVNLLFDIQQCIHIDLRKRCSIDVFNLETSLFLWHSYTHFGDSMRRVDVVFTKYLIDVNGLRDFTFESRS